MKPSAALRRGSLLLVSCLAVAARAAAWHYQFTAGQTNAFAVEISVRSEAGNDQSTSQAAVEAIRAIKQRQ